MCRIPVLCRAAGAGVLVAVLAAAGDWSSGVQADPAERSGRAVMAADRSGRADRSGDAASAPAGTWMIGPRILPPPEAASDRLRQIIAAMPAPSAAPSLTTAEDWRAVDVRNARFADELIQRWRVEVNEQTLAGVHVYRLTPAQVSPQNANRLFVHIHGGAFILGAGRSGLPEAVEIAALLRMPVISIDYRMPPDHPAPAAMDDTIAVWREVLKTHDPSRVALGGTSAGGNLTLVATLRMKDLGLPLPAALFVGTPAADLVNRGDARFINDGIDHALVHWSHVSGTTPMYARGHSLDDPYISPIHGNFDGFPPTYLISGTRDLFLSDTVRIHRKLRASNVAAELHVYEGFAHADYIDLFDTPESAEHYRELEAFVASHLGR